ncbi:MAG: hypothetical protein HQ515_01565, partial [Phycisphaeraceae bacterium]|nr:hypothetical protein [Phycisphaeraceae bacterium]
MNKEMIKVLAWKEWHEQRGTLAFCCVLLMSLTAIGLQSRLMPDSFIIRLSFSLLGGTVFPLIISAGLIAPEREDRTLNTLLAQPLAAGGLLVIKLITGVILCLVPILGVTVTACLMAGNREMTMAQINYAGLCTAIMALVFFIWSLSLTINQGEHRTVSISTAVLVASTLCFVVGLASLNSPAGKVAVYRVLVFGNPMSLLLFMCEYPARSA